MRIISASSYSDYILCPLIYKYKYLDNYQDIFSVKTEEIIKGDLIHKLIYNHSRDINYPQDYIDENIDIKNAFNHYIEKYSNKAPNTFNEYTFNVKLETDIEQVILNGRIDQITFNEDNITIIDWKTTNRKTKISLLTNKLQMDFYAYSVSKIKNVDSINIKLVYLNLEQEENILINKDKLVSIERDILKMINSTNPEIKNYVPNPLELAKDKYICEICNFYNFCQGYI
ncbi:MAG: PD-(D/E)XK nuclease family protein [Candidatus Sericytochromatia bacterium]